MNSPASDKEILEARKALWRMGNLYWKLDASQRDIYDFLKGLKKRVGIINCSRRLGKSYLLTIIAIEACLKQEKAIVKFLQPEQKMIRVNIRPIMDKILNDCPPELKPEFKTQDNIYVFPNGSEIQLAGTDNGNHEKIRGGDAHLCIIDEAAFVKSELGYIVKSILIPTTTLTGGKILLSSTSPKHPGHDFQKYMERAEIDGNLIRKTIDDAILDAKDDPEPRITAEIVAEIEEEYVGGRSNDDFRREYLCETITDGDNAIVPEFDAVKEDIITEWPKPAFCDQYVAMDIGFKDLTAVLFGYYDFENAVTVIEDEIIINGPQMTTAVLADLIFQKEFEVFSDPVTAEMNSPRRRVADNNLILLNDLQRQYGLSFLPTVKDNKEAALNDVRNAMAAHQIVINPKCKVLISHLQNGTWASNRKTFSRSPDNGHYDAIDALIYFHRNIDKNHNPFPSGYRRHTGNTDSLFVSPHAYDDTGDDFYDNLKEMFRVKRVSPGRKKS